jgi:threonine dehydrogenase-like Zn-dependent dehydrogenase
MSKSPGPARNQVLAEIRCVGICGSDVGIYQGDHPDRPLADLLGKPACACHDPILLRKRRTS